MERKPLSLHIGDTRQTDRGTLIHITKITKQRTPPGPVAQHEAAHIIAAQAAGGIALATIVGTSEYAGATWPVVMTAMSAMAAKADGHGGTGWDEFLTEFILGVNPQGAASSAASYLASRHDYLYVVASKLEEKQTITQSDVNDAYKEVDDERNGNWEVTIHMQAKDGSTHIYTRRSRNGIVELPEENTSNEKAEEQQQSLARQQQSE